MQEFKIDLGGDRVFDQGVVSKRILEPLLRPAKIPVALKEALSGSGSRSNAILGYVLGI